MLLTFKDNNFVAVSTFAEKDIPKGARFFWNATAKRWETSDAHKAAQLVEYADEAALEALKRAGAINEQRYVALSGVAKKNTLTTDKKAKIEAAAARLADAPEEVAAIHSLLKLLAGQCDGARKLDGAGFNAMDTNFGHQLAGAPRLSPKQAAYGREMLWKYRTQIDGPEFSLIFSSELRAAAEKEIDKKLKRKEAREQRKRGVSADGPAIVDEAQHTPAITPQQDAWMREADEVSRRLDREEAEQLRVSEVVADAELTPTEREEVKQMGERDGVEVTFTATGKCSTCGAPEIDNKRTCEHTPREAKPAEAASQPQEEAAEQHGATIHVIKETKRERPATFLDFSQPDNSACPELWLVLDRLRAMLEGDTEQKRRVLDEAIGTAFEIVRAETKAGNEIQFTKKRVA